MQIRKNKRDKKPTPITSETATIDDLLLKAFDKSIQANLITVVSTGRILIANRAACRLLGYSKKELLTKTRSAIFNTDESNFKKMLKERTGTGHSKAYITAIKKDGKILPCEITSAVFKDANGTKISINTIEDISDNILKQKNIDLKREEVVAADIIAALAKADLNLEERIEQELKLKAKQIAEAIEQTKETDRSDLGKELHDNVNQLLGASKLFIDLAKAGGENVKMYLKRSSDYTLMAIEEIRMLAKGLTVDTINTVGLCSTIEDLINGIMETGTVNIISECESFNEKTVNREFKLNIYRIIQEQLNNILKHAEASEIKLGLLQKKKSLILSISDNGKGFDPLKKSKGIGIANIKSRAQSFNGIFTLVSQPGQGCTVSIRFPL